jgi:hypothetical protein
LQDGQFRVLRARGAAIHSPRTFRR